MTVTNTRVSVFGGPGPVGPQHVVDPGLADNRAEQFRMLGEASAREQPAVRVTPAITVPVAAGPAGYGQPPGAGAGVVGLCLRSCQPASCQARPCSPSPCRLPRRHVAAF